MCRTDKTQKDNVRNSFTSFCLLTSNKEMFKSTFSLLQRDEYFMAVVITSDEKRNRVRVQEGGRGGTSGTLVSHQLVRPRMGIEGLFSLDMSGSEVKPLSVKVHPAQIIHCNRCILCWYNKAPSIDKLDFSLFPVLSFFQPCQIFFFKV